MARLTIFHTSDFHNKLTPGLAQRLRDLKEASGRKASPEAYGDSGQASGRKASPEAYSDSLMFDCGDAIWAGNVYWRPGGEPILDLMNSVPYDAMCMGNREFHFTDRGMKAKLSRARFPVLSANLRQTRSSIDVSVVHFSTCRPFAVAQEGEVPSYRIGYFGLSVPCITERMLSKKVSDFYFTDPIETARELVPKLRAECDLLIALTHIGLKKDIELAEAVPGIDIILGGHTHTIAEERVGDTMIFHSGHHAHHVRKIEIEFRDSHSAQIPKHQADGLQVQSELIPLGEA